MKQRPDLRLFVVSDRNDKLVSYRSQLEFVERVKAHSLPITHVTATATDKDSHDLFAHGHRLAADCANEARDQVVVAPAVNPSPLLVPPIDQRDPPVPDSKDWMCVSTNICCRKEEVAPTVQIWVGPTYEEGLRRKAERDAEITSRLRAREAREREAREREASFPLIPNPEVLKRLFGIEDAKPVPTAEKQTNVPKPVLTTKVTSDAMPTTDLNAEWATANTQPVLTNTDPVLMLTVAPSDPCQRLICNAPSKPFQDRVSQPN
jgi:hypothetical protein